MPPGLAGAPPQVVQQKAATVAQALPRPDAMTPAGPAPAPVRRPLPARQVGQIAGRPPVPMATPAYADIRDPVPEATKRIETAANRVLAEQLLPPVTATPDGHMPDLIGAPGRPLLTREQRRMILLGEPAMDAARITPQEKARLLAIREQILAPPAADGATPDAAVPPTPLKVTTDPLPPAELTVAERDLFTGVLARLLADTDEEAKTILDGIRATSETFPGGRLQATENGIPELGKAWLPKLADAVRDAAVPQAEAMGVAGKTLDDAVAARRAAVEAERRRAAAALRQQADQATTVAAANADAQLSDAAQAKAVAADARKRAGAMGRSPRPGFRAIAEAAVARIQDKVSEAIARFRLQEHERVKALDDAAARQLAAYETAVTADELAAAKANGVLADKPAPTDPEVAQNARRRVSAATNTARKWLTEQSALLKTAVERLKAETTATVTSYVTDVETEGANAYRDLKAWGATQDGAGESWWQDSVQNLDRWADQAYQTATTWAGVQGRLARLEMQRDLQRIREGIDHQLSSEGEDAAKFAAMTADQRRRFVDAVLSSPETQAHVTAGLAKGLEQRLVAAERPEFDKDILSEVMALPKEQWEAIEFLAQAKNPDFSAAKQSDTIFKSGVDKIGTDEDAIFDALSGLQPIELEAVKKHYANFHGDLYDDLDSELSGDEWRRAQALMKGDVGGAAAEAIHDAVWGPGTNEKKIMEALRGLTPTQRIAADEHYRQQYHQSLASRLAEDLSGSELDQAMALLEGRTTDADAFEVDTALRGGFWGPDQAGVTSVYDRIHQESLARAKAEGWTSTELDAEVAARGGALEKSFNDKLSGVPDYGWGDQGQSTLRTAFTSAFPFDPAKRELVNALADNDMVTADAALMQTEREGIYADDSVLKGVIRKQMDRATERVQLDRGPELSKGIDATIQREVQERYDEVAKSKGAVRPFTERELMDRRMKLRREADNTIQDEAFDRARDTSAMLDTVLRKKHGITLDNMISENMSGGDRREAQAQLKVMRTAASDPAAKRERRLDWAYNRVRYAIEGLGTDMDELKGGLGGLTKDEMDALDARWQRDHDHETLKEAVQGDTSGREEDDLVDLVDHGASETVAQRMDELKRRHQRDEESVGFIGAHYSKAESRRTAAALKEMEALSADLDNPNLDPRKRAHLSELVNQRIDNAGYAIEAQRAAIDSLADNITTVFQYIVGALAVVIGAIVAVVSGGTALPALIAIAGSVIGTLGSMAIKAAVKGGAYGAEEFATDLIVGAVDLIVTVATAGTVKGGSLLTAAKTELKQLSQTSIRMALKQTARQTAAGSVRTAAEAAARKPVAARVVAGIGKTATQFAKTQAHQLATSLPTAIVANLLNERNLRNGNPLHNIARGTFEASLQNLKMGVAMGVAGHALQSSLTHLTVVTHPPISPVATRLAEYKTWQAENPGRPREEYVAHMEAKQAAAAYGAETARIETREARRALLSEIPPRERGGIADVPIVRVSETEFRALNGGAPGDALLHVHQGQAAVVIREGAPPGGAAKVAGELRDRVAPGTAGRTVNPVEALPERLQNRVKVAVVDDPKLGLDGVRAVPEFHPDGHIIGVKLEVGPNARAIDIQNHVETIDAMRKLTGLSGRARLMAHEVARAIGVDVITPLDRGRWEAALEIRKLSTVIDDRVMRLAEEGVDPRSRERIAEEIAGLERQYASEVERFGQGADAEAHGYVAAKGQKREPTPKGAKEPVPAKAAASTVAGKGEPAPAEAPKPAEAPAPKVAGKGEPTPAAAPKPASPEQVRAREILSEIRDLETKRTAAEDARDSDTAATPHTNYVREHTDSYVKALKEIAGSLPPQLRERIRGLRSAPIESPTTLAALHTALSAAPEFQAILERGKPVSLVNKLESVGESLGQITTQSRRFAERNRTIAEADARISGLTEEYRTTHGRVVPFTDQPLALHPDLPEPLAGLFYVPEAQTAVAEKAHVAGYRSELRLANHIAETGRDAVIQYGHRVVEHGADIVSIDKTTGRVTLWDSKYRELGGTSAHSDTFTDAGKRQAAVEGALRFLRSGEGSLTPDMRARAISSLSDGNFDAVTAHTRGGAFKENKIDFTSNKETSRD
jgi:hypothetical protein